LIFVAYKLHKMVTNITRSPTLGFVMGVC